MKVAVVIGYNKRPSFNYGIVDAIIDECNKTDDVSWVLIDLYEDTFHPSGKPDNSELVEKYQNILKTSDVHVIVSPVWWFRCTSMIEGFLDQVYTPGFAYNFKQLTKTYGLPVAKLSDKRILTYLTHGAPALPVYTLYLNSVWGRLRLGVYSFCYGWGLNPKNFNNIKFRQFFSIPFTTDKIRQKYLQKVRKDIQKEIKRWLKKHK